MFLCMGPPGSRKQKSPSSERQLRQRGPGDGVEQGAAMFGAVHRPRHLEQRAERTPPGFLQLGEKARGPRDRLFALRRDPGEAVRRDQAKWSAKEPAGKTERRDPLQARPDQRVRGERRGSSEAMGRSYSAHTATTGPVRGTSAPSCVRNAAFPISTVSTCRSGDQPSAEAREGCTRSGRDIAGAVRSSGAARR